MERGPRRRKINKCNGQCQKNQACSTTRPQEPGKNHAAGGRPARMHGKSCSYSFTLPKPGAVSKAPIRKGKMNHQPGTHQAVPVQTFRYMPCQQFILALWNYKLSFHFFCFFYENASLLLLLDSVGPTQNPRPQDLIIPIVVPYYHSVVFHKERWLSGRRQRFAKPS